MEAAPPIPDEARRIAQLRSLGVLDSLPEEAFDHITALASAICETPIALISLVDENRQWFKSRVGLDEVQTPREVAFCAHAIHTPDQVMVVENAELDRRFHDNPLVIGHPDIRFYAGAPIVSGDGHALGTVCVIDRRSRTISEAQQSSLQSLAKLVMTLIEHDAQRRAQEAERAKAVARESEIQAALTAAGLDLLSFVDADYRYRYVNRCYLEYWARSESEIIGRRIPELMGERLFQDVVKGHFDHALAGQEVAYEALIDFPGTGPRTVQVSYLPVRSASGEVSGVVVRAHDIEKLRQREVRLQATVEQLEHKALELQRFIHIVSHDLREPINTISNFAGLLAEDPQMSASPAASRYLNFVLDGSQRIKVLLEDLVELLVLDRHAMGFSPVDINVLARHVQDDLRSSIDQSGALIEVSELLPVMGDATLLRILMQNLVANAIKFCPRDRLPVVRIETLARSDGRTSLRVLDNGIGIPEDQTERIFDLFTRLNNKRDFAGSGLGLSICRRIVDLHQGRIHVMSQVGAGSCFEVELSSAGSLPTSSAST
ncbi:sensor histidine kinase [Hydrogenophaga luteola]|uniref:histidine kinase n=1 Tax=Hydrogenophaga luteola TaxID=1591122 RepID=A0ABV7W6I1_9BURK